MEEKSWWNVKIDNVEYLKSRTVDPKLSHTVLFYYQKFVLITLLLGCDKTFNTKHLKSKMTVQEQRFLKH